MNKITSNSFESVLFFVIYICFQDGKLSKEEVAELSLQSMVLKKFYFECFGEICDLEIESLAYEMRQELEDKYNVFSTEPTDVEVEHINTLITDIRLRDIALMCAKLSAAEDGFNELEEAKWNYWFKRWTA